MRSTFFHRFSLASAFQIIRHYRPYHCSVYLALYRQKYQVNECLKNSLESRKDTKSDQTCQE